VDPAKRVCRRYANSADTQTPAKFSNGTVNIVLDSNCVVFGNLLNLSRSDFVRTEYVGDDEDR
jgi:hypothetical protein